MRQTNSKIESRQLKRFSNKNLGQAVAMGKRINLATASCPECGQVGSVRKIIYGMPGPDFDFEKYEVGGCVVTGHDPQHACRECGWSGTLGKRSE